MPTKPTAFTFWTVCLIALLAACARPVDRDSDSLAVHELRPGDYWSGTTLTTGSREAVSIWTLCRPDTRLNDRTETDCQVPAVPLAVGPSAAALPAVINLANWGQLAWTLLVDGRPVRLDAFGTFEFLLPRKAFHGRDATFVYRAWDVVLADPAPGTHTLEATATRFRHTGKDVGTLIETVEWVIHLVVE